MARSRGAGVAWLAALLAVGCTGTGTPRVAPDASSGRRAIADWELVGRLDVPTGHTFRDTTVGGLSSLTYDADRGVFYALSDDPATVNPVRFYTLRIDLADGRLDPGDVSFLDVTYLRDASGQPFAAGTLDPEGLVLARPDSLIVSSEGLAAKLVPPFVRGFGLSGAQTTTLPIPDKFLPDNATRGVRPNLAFESLNVSPDRRWLFVGTEAALVQDGPSADVGVPSTARIVRYDLATLTPGREVAYPVDAVAEAPIPPDAFRVNGLVELLPLDDAGTMLALERSFSVGAGYTVRLFAIDTAVGTDVSAHVALPPSVVPVSKHLVFDVGRDLDIEPDNLEGMAFGTPLADGRVPLVMVSDNNFDEAAVTQFIVVAVRLVAAR